MGDQHRPTLGQRRGSHEGQLTTSLLTLGRGVAALTLVGAGAAQAQTTKMPSTLRYGSGLLDVPVASVIPHLSLVTTFSGFWTSHDTEILTNDLGVQVGERPFDGAFRSDASITLGLFDRLEIGTSLQAFEDEEKGGDVVGAFGRLLILRPEDHGIGLAGDTDAAQASRSVALALLKEALALNPRHLMALNNYAMYLTEMGQIDEADKVFRRILADFPGQRLALHNYGSSLLRRRAPDYELALQCLERARALGYPEDESLLGELEEIVQSRSESK